MNVAHKALQSALDELERNLEALLDQKLEIEMARQRAYDACAHELQQFARECGRAGGNPGLDLAVRGLDDLLADIQFDSIVELDREIADVSLRIGDELRKQGVA